MLLIHYNATFDFMATEPSDQRDVSPSSDFKNSVYLNLLLLIFFFQFQPQLYLAEEDKIRAKWRTLRKMLRE